MRKFFYVREDGEVVYCENRSIMLLKVTREILEGGVPRRVMEGADHWRIKGFRGNWWIWYSVYGEEWVYGA